MEAILGSLLGGVFRLVPEGLKWLDSKDERKHELAMFKEQVSLERERGEQKLQEIGTQNAGILDAGAMGTLRSAIDQQTEMVKTAGKGWVAALSASVRPVMTYYLLALYGLAKMAGAYLLWSSGLSLAETIEAVWSPEDMALLSGVVNYWILDRTLHKRGLA